MKDKPVEKIIIETEEAIIKVLNDSNLSVGILTLIIGGIHSNLQVMTREAAEKGERDGNNAGI